MPWLLSGRYLVLAALAAAVVIIVWLARSSRN